MGERTTTHVWLGRKLVDQIQELVASVILLKASQVGVVKNFGCNFHSQVTAAGARALFVVLSHIH